MITAKRRALIDYAKKFVKPMDTLNAGWTIRERYRVDFVQMCVREIDKQFKSQTLLFATESTQSLWLNTPKITRIPRPEPGSIVIFGHYNQNGPLSTGHLGIVTECIGNDYMQIIEGSLLADHGQSAEGIYIKTRLQSMTHSQLRTCGFLLPWAS